MILALRKTRKAVVQDGFYVTWWRCVSRPFELVGEGYLTLLLWGVSLINVPYTCGGYPLCVLEPIDALFGTPFILIGNFLWNLSR
jgi:hypothetical protein